MAWNSYWLLSSVDPFLNANPHLWNYFPEPPAGTTKKRPIQKYIVYKNRYCRDKQDPSKFRKPTKGEVPSKYEAPNAYAFIKAYKDCRCMSSDSDDELSIHTPPQLKELHSASAEEQPIPFIPDPPSFINRMPKPQRIMSDPFTKPKGLPNSADISYSDALKFQHIYPANPDIGQESGNNFICWRTADVKVKDGKNENIVDKISILIDLGSEVAVKLTTRACITDNGDGVLVFAPVHNPLMTMLWKEVKEEIEMVAELGEGDGTGMITAVSSLCFNNLHFSAAHRYSSARNSSHTDHQSLL